MRAQQSWMFHTEDGWQKEAEEIAGHAYECQHGDIGMECEFLSDDEQKALVERGERPINNETGKAWLVRMCESCADAFYKAKGGSDVQTK